MNSCKLCPRRCGVNRGAGSRNGFCGESAELRLACASIHYGEEPPITGTGGSGAIFVSGCNLGCVFCQNFQISRAVPRGPAIFPGLFSGQSRGRPLGRAVTTEDFAGICLVLQERGAENINVVTGSHAVPALAEGIRTAKAGAARPEKTDPARLGKTGRARLNIPVLWNSSAYELPETLELLDGLVDVFLPDMKTLDEAVAARYFRAPDYPETARTAIGKMIGMAEKSRGKAGFPAGLPAVMVRHLVLPGHSDSTKEVLRWFAENCAGRPGVALSLMFQYTAIGSVGTRGSNGTRNPRPEQALPAAPGRPVSEGEYRAVMAWLGEYGIEDGYCQELVPAAGDRLPDFEKDNPFPSDLSVPVWHWRSGFL
jgi:putative pyruvate formate lyase activating enzyme